MNPQATKIDINWLGESWKVLTSRIGEFIGMGVIAFVASIIISQLVQIPIGLMLGMVRSDSFALLFGAMGATILANFFAQGITYVFGAGILIFALKLLRGEQAKFEDFFLPFKNFGNFFLGGLLYGVAGFVAALFCCFPVYIAMGMLMFMFPLIYDRKLSPVEAFQQSIQLLKDQWLMATLYMFLAYLFAMVGALACLVGILATMPIMYIAQAVAYHKIVGGATTVYSSPSQYPRSPQDLQNMPAAPTDWSAGSTPAPAPPSQPTPPPDEPMSGSMAGDESTVAEMPAYSPGVAADDAATMAETPAVAPHPDDMPTMAETPAVAPHADDMPTMAETPAVSADDMPTMGTMDAIQPNDEPKPPHG